MQEIEQAKSFEAILASQKDLLATKAWRICYLLVGICVFLSMIIAVLILTQEKEIVLIRVDNRTGEAEVLSKLSETNITEDEAIAKFFAAKYLTLREQYNYFSLQNDYEVVQLFSSEQTRNEYLDIFERSDSPDKALGEDFNIKVDIISINISSATDPHKLASIRFRKTISDLKNSKTKEKFYNARLVFVFEPERKVSEKFRLNNPLGFKVVSYQAGQELTEN